MLTIYDTNHTIRFTTPINKGSKRVFKLMGDDYITLKFSVKTPVDFGLGDYCDVPGFGRFELCKPYKPNYNKSTGGYDYELMLEAQHMKWRNKIMRYLPMVGGSETSWTLTATAEVHLEQVIQNITALSEEKMSDGTTRLHPNYKYNGTAPYTKFVHPDVDASAKTITYDSTNIIDALTAIAEAFECEWWLDDHIICLGKCEDANEYIDIEIDKNVSQMSHSNSQEKYVTRIIPFGSERNISPRYRKDLLFNVTRTNGGGNVVSDETRPLNLEWFDNTTAVFEPDSKCQAILDFARTNQLTISSKSGGDILVASYTQNHSEINCGDWKIQLSEFRPLLRFANLNGSKGLAKIIVKIEGTLKDSKSAFRDEYESKISLYAPNVDIPVYFQDQSLNIPEGLTNLTIKVEVYIDLGANSSVEISINSMSNGKIKLSNANPNGKVTGLIIEKLNEEGEVSDTFTGAIYNPLIADDVASRNWIKLPDNATMSTGDRFRIVNVNKNKVKSSYFSSRYSAYANMQNVVTNGIVRNRLMLPESYGKFYVDCVEDLPEEQYVEDVVIFEDVYPRAVCRIISIDTIDRKETVQNDDGTSTDKTFTAFKVKDSFFTAAHPFSSDYIIPGKKLEITFQDGYRYTQDDIDRGTLDDGTPVRTSTAYDGEVISVGSLHNPESGKLNGWTFEVGFTESDDGSAIWEIVRDNNSYVPNEILRPEIGDQFVLVGFDTAAVDELYVNAAEEELLRRAKKYLEKINTDPSTYDCTMMPDVMKAGLNLELGTRVNLINDAFIPLTIDENERVWGRKSRVIGYEMPLDIPYDNPIYTIGEAPSYSRIGEIADNLEALSHSMSSAAGTDYITNKPIYVIGQGDSTPPSNTNVFSSLRSLWEFARKTVSQTISSIWSFIRGLRIGDYVENVSGAAIDQNGNAEVESLLVRSYMKVYELIYNRLNAQEGNTSFADVGTIDEITDNGDGTYVFTMRKRWEGDFTAFQPGDIIYGYVNELGNSGQHHKSWAWIQSVDRVANTLTVYYYPDADCPSGINHAFTANMIVSRWGNNIEANQETYANPDYQGIVVVRRGEEYRNIRQSSFYISCDDGNIVELMGVYKPILDPENYGTVIGKMPIGLLDATTEELINKDQPYIFARGIIVQDLIRVDYHGTIIRTANYRGEWDEYTAYSEDYYKSNREIYDTVSWANCLWQCVIDATTDEPGTSGAWLRMAGTTNQEVRLWTIEPSSNIVSIRNSSVEPQNLTCIVRLHSSYGDRSFVDNAVLYNAGAQLYYSLDGVNFHLLAIGTPEPLELEDGSGLIELESGDNGLLYLTVGGEAINTADITDRIFFELRDVESQEVLTRLNVPVVRDGEDGEKGDPGEKGEPGEAGVPGPSGRDGLMIYPAGYYDPQIRYESTNETSPVVMYNAEGQTADREHQRFFVLKGNKTYRGADEINVGRETPALDVALDDDRTCWIPFEKFNAIFADIIMADFAKLSSAVFYGDWMISQQGVLADGTPSTNYEGFKTETFTPNFAINFRTGEMNAGSGVFTGYIQSKFKKLGQSDASPCEFSANIHLMPLISPGICRKVRGNRTLQISCHDEIVLPTASEYIGARIILCENQFRYDEDEDYAIIRTEDGTPIFGIAPETASPGVSLGCQGSKYVRLLNGIAEFICVPRCRVIQGIGEEMGEWVVANHNAVGFFGHN